MEGLALNGESHEKEDGTCNGDWVYGVSRLNSKLVTPQP